MNVALGAVLIFILLIPPVAFYLSYIFGGFSKAGSKFSLLEGILASAVLSLLIHAVALLFIRQEIRFDVLVKLAGGELKDIQASVSNQLFRRLVFQFALYNFLIVTFFILLGRAARFLVDRPALDNGQRELFRLHNRWWYLFNGFENDIANFDLVFVDAVMDTKDGTVAYSGFLIDYVCDGETLDRIYLGDVVRRSFRPETKRENDVNYEPGIPQTIPGEIFTIPYKNCVNLKLRFILLADDLGVIEEMPVTGDDVEERLQD